MGDVSKSFNDLIAEIKAGNEERTFITDDTRFELGSAAFTKLLIESAVNGA